VLRALDLRAHSPMYPQLTDGPDECVYWYVTSTNYCIVLP
jgi:hypothetical protein